MEVFMLRAISAFVVSILLAHVAIAQNPQAESGMQCMMGQQQGMSTMHEQMMKGMQADLDSMHSTLQKMKEQVSKVSDQSIRDQLQLNIDMWQR
jgi:hypothetical protein